MADQYDGGVVIGTEIDSAGAEKGFDELIDAIRSLGRQIDTLGRSIRSSFSAGAQATKNATSNLLKYRETVDLLDEKANALLSTMDKMQASSRKGSLLDMGDAPVKLSKLQKDITSFAASLVKLGPTWDKAMAGNSQAAANFSAKVLELEQQASTLRATLATIGTQKIPNQAYEDVKRDIAEISEDLNISNPNGLMRQLAEAKWDDPKRQELLADIQAAEKELTKLQALKASMESDGTAHMPFSETEAYKQMSAALEENISKLRERAALLQQAPTPGAVSSPAVSGTPASTPAVPVGFQQTQAEIVAADTAFGRFLTALRMAPPLTAQISAGFANVQARVSGAVSSMRSGLQSVGSAVANGIRHPLQTVDALAGKLLTAFGQLGKVAVSSLGGLAKKAISGLGSAAKSACKGLGSLTKNFGLTQKAAKKTGKHLKSLGFIVKQMIFFRLLSSVFNGISQGFQNLAQASDKANTHLSALKSGLTQLKNSLAAAFQPILTVVTPILTSFMSYLSALIAKLGEFLSALTGAKTFTKAVAVQEDYAASLGKTAGAAKDAKRQLAGFDDLNILSKNDSSGGGGAGVVNPADMFAEEEISTPVSDFANQLRDAFQAGDYERLGQILGGKINGAIRIAGNLVSWKHLGKKITKVLTGAARTINSLFATIDWEGAGNTVAEGANTIIYSLQTWFTSVDWGLIGSSIARGLNGAIAGIDWWALGGTLGSYFNTLIYKFLGFVQTFDWAAAGTSLATGINGFVSSIDWAAAGTLLSDGVKGALTFISEAIKNTDWQQLGNDVALFLANVDWSGIATSLFDGIGAALGGLTAFLWGLIEDAWNAVVVWWEEVAYEDGEFTIAGLLRGIGDALVNIGTWIWDNIFVPFIDGFCEAFGIHSPSTVMQEQGGYIIEGLLSGLTDTWGNVKSFFSDKVEDAKTWGKDLCQNMADGMRSFQSKVSEAATSVAQKIQDILGFSEPDEGPLSNFHTYMPDMLDLMEEGILANRYKAVNAAASVAQAISNEVQNGDYGTGNIVPTGQIDAGLTSFADKISDSFTGLMDRLQSIANRVTFAAPTVATGAVPYRVAAVSSGNGEQLGNTLNMNNEALMALISRVVGQATTEVVSALKNYGGSGSGGPGLTTTQMLNEVNRKANMMNSTPFVL